jgi:hypothetical protein
MFVKKIQIDFADFMVREDDILHAHIYENTHMDSHKARVLFELMEQNKYMEKHPMLISLERNVKITRDAMAFSASNHSTKYSIAEAYVSPHPFHRFLSTIYLHLHQPEVPTKFFPAVSHAIEWLNQFHPHPKKSL